jgi:hypothetical protein
MKATCVFRGVMTVALLLLSPGGARAKSARRTARATAPVPAERAAKADKSDATPTNNDKGDGAGESTQTSGKTSDGKTIKTKTYTFGAMDVEGKLKTPQLLYFLNRVKLELDMSAPDKRSFMKELGRSADDKSL